MILKVFESFGMKFHVFDRFCQNGQIGQTRGPLPWENESVRNGNLRSWNLWKKWISWKSWFWGYFWDLLFERFLTAFSGFDRSGQTGTAVSRKWYHNARTGQTWPDPSKSLPKTCFFNLQNLSKSWKIKVFIRYHLRFDDFQGSGVRDPGSEVRDLGSEVWDLRSELWDRRSEIQDLEVLNIKIIKCDQVQTSPSKYEAHFLGKTSTHRTEMEKSKKWRKRVFSCKILGITFLKVSGHCLDKMAQTRPGARKKHAKTLFLTCKKCKTRRSIWKERTCKNTNIVFYLICTHPFLSLLSRPATLSRGNGMRPTKRRKKHEKWQMRKVTFTLTFEHHKSRFFNKCPVSSCFRHVCNKKAPCSGQFACSSVQNKWSFPY